MSIKSSILVALLVLGLAPVGEAKSLAQPQLHFSLILIAKDFQDRRSMIVEESDISRTECGRKKASSITRWKLFGDRTFMKSITWICIQSGRLP